MAERPPVKTKKLTRDKLAKFLPNHESIKAFEDVVSDVSETLPDAIGGLTESADTVISGEVFRRRSDPPPVPGGASDAGQILAVEAFRRRSPQAAAVAQDGSDLGQVLAIETFRRRAQPAPVVGAESDASAILATQVFGA